MSEVVLISNKGGMAEGKELGSVLQDTSYFAALTKEEKKRLIHIVSRNPFFSQAFNPSSDRDYSNIPIDENDDYKEFIIGLCNKLELMKYSRGDFLCHYGEQGDRMYLISEGKIGIFIKSNKKELEKQLERLENLNNLLSNNEIFHISEETVLKNEKFEKKELLIKNIQRFFASDQLYLYRLLSHFDMVDCWKEEQLYLLASQKAYMYMRDCCITYQMVTTKGKGDIIGEQALLTKEPRNASLIALSDVTVLTLDKVSFEKYMGIVAEKQEERMKFFAAAFPMISKRILSNFYCMFHRSLKSRGEIITSRGIFL